MLSTEYIPEQLGSVNPGDAIHHQICQFQAPDLRYQTTVVPRLCCSLR